RDIIPPSFFDTSSPSGATWKAAVDLFASGGPLELAIQEYWKNVDQPAAVRGPITVKIAKLVNDAIGAWQSEDPDDARHVILNAKLLRQADRTLAVTDFGNSTWATRLLSKIGKQMLISQWLSAISAAEKSQVDTDSSPNSAPAPGAVPSLQVVPKELMWLNNSQSFETYRYTFKFAPLSPSDLAALKKYIESLPKELQKLIPSVPNASKAPAKWALLAMGVFKITISAETSSQLGVGPMANTSFTPLWGERTLFGVFGEVGVGLNDLPGLPDKMQINSPFKVNADAFENALFEIKAAGASAGVNVPFVQGTDVGVTVRRMSFTLTDGTLLEGDLPEGKFIPDPVVGLSASDPKKIQELAKARSRKDLANDLWSAGIGATYCMGKLVVGRPSPEHWVSPPKERTATGGDNRTVAAFFKVDSGDINTDLNGWSRRFLLESVLAIDLYLFNGAPGISVIGHASPEGTPRHNLILSRLRADVVTQAILDAIVIDSAFIIPAGAGDELARRTPVDPSIDPNDPKSKGVKTFDEPDPDGNTNKRDEFAKAHTEQSSRWPEFRKVVIEWWGQFFIKVETTGEKSDQDAPEQQPDATPPQDSAPPQGPPSQQPPPGQPMPAPAPTDIA
ncbi:MAG: hypothetical protein ACRELB_15570, partial [Polyangiaceae bacterium]